jgi:hypothetical protein
MEILRLDMIGEKLITCPPLRNEIPHSYLRLGHGIGIVDRKGPTLRGGEDPVERG